MKKVVFVLLCLISCSCNAQTIPVQKVAVVDLKKKDIIAFSFSENAISSLEPVYGEEFYNKKGLLVLFRNWANYGANYVLKEYTFVQGKDTMNISCNCGQEVNFYVKNLKFQKGSYKIERQEKGDFVKAKTLFADGTLNKRKVINSYNRWKKSREDTFINTSWGELDFIVIDAATLISPASERKN